MFTVCHSLTIFTRSNIISENLNVIIILDLLCIAFIPPPAQFLSLLLKVKEAQDIDAKTAKQNMQCNSLHR